MLFVVALPMFFSPCSICDADDAHADDDDDDDDDGDVGNSGCTTWKKSVTKGPGNTEKNKKKRDLRILS